MRFLLKFVLFLLFPSITLLADVTGTILGTVKDPSGGLVVGARVTAANADTGQQSEGLTDSNGGYRILALPIGRYTVTVSAPGFQSFETTNIDLKVNDQLRVDATLQLGNVQQKIEVNGAALQVETSSTQLGQVIEQKQILALPLNGRSFIDLLGLQAQTT